MSAKLRELLDKRDEEQVILTFATSIDGIIGKRGELLPISSQETLILTHTIRNYADGIVVGIGTVLNDNPNLTTRLVKDPRNPRVVVVDPFLKCPEDAKFIPRKPILLVSESCDTKRIERFSQLGATVIKIPSLAGSSRLDLNKGINELRKLGLQKIMIEGGAEVIKECLSGRVTVDLVIATIAPIFVGSGVSLANTSCNSITKLKNIQYEQYGVDMVVYGEL